MFLTRSGDYLYFTADDGIHGRELWKLDRDDRVSLVIDLVAGPESRKISMLHDGGGLLYFDAGGIYRSGGTLETTIRIDSTLELFAKGLTWGNSHYFVAGTPQASSLLWAGNNSTDTLRSVTDDFQELSGIPVGLHPAIVPFKNQLYVVGINARLNKPALYVMDELGETLAPRMDATGAFVQLDGATPSFCAVDDALYFNVPDEFGRHELWVTGGSRESTRRVYSAPPGTEFTILQLARAGSAVILVVNVSGIGVELWKSDGTQDGTQLLKDIAPGPASSAPYEFWPLGDRCVFIAAQPEFGNELWISDGTAEGTRLLKDLVPGPRSSDPYQLLPYRDWLLFSCENYTYGEELWRTDGTPEGTMMVKDINPGLADSGPYHLREFNDKVYFAATHHAYGEELWETDATSEGTRLAARIKPALRAVASSYPRHLTPFKNHLYFSAEPQDGIRRIFRTQGNSESTEPVLLQLLEEGYSVTGIERGPDTLYITTTSENGMQRFWESGGEPETTRAMTAPLDRNRPSPLVDILGPERYTRLVRSPLPPDAWATLNRRTYFPAYTPESGSELWVADHDTGEASLFFESMAGPASGSPVHITATGDHIWFVADDSNKGKELWISNGTQNGTRMIVDFNRLPFSGAPHYVINAQGQLFALAQGRNKTQDFHWFQPPEFETTSPIIVGSPNPTVSNIAQLTACGDDVYFTATSTDCGNELWKVVRWKNRESLPGSMRQADVVCNIAPDQLFDEQENRWRHDGRKN